MTRSLYQESVLALAPRKTSCHITCFGTFGARGAKCRDLCLKRQKINVARQVQRVNFEPHGQHHALKRKDLVLWPLSWVIQPMLCWGD